MALQKLRIQMKIFADRDYETVEESANSFLKTLAPDNVGTIFHETRVDEFNRLIFITKINYTTPITVQ